MFFLFWYLSLDAMRTSFRSLFMTYAKTLYSSTLCANFWTNKISRWFIPLTLQVMLYSHVLRTKLQCFSNKSTAFFNASCETIIRWRNCMSQSNSKLWPWIALWHALVKSKKRKQLRWIISSLEKKTFCRTPANFQEPKHGKKNRNLQEREFILQANERYIQWLCSNYYISRNQNFEGRYFDLLVWRHCNTRIYILLEGEILLHFWEVDFTRN